jgi:transcription-repair coupling factor (superfamily II helicase)
VPDNEEKLELYRRLAVAQRTDVVDEIAEELVDRFGRMPDAARHLLDLRRIRLLGSEAKAVGDAARPHALRGRGSGSRLRPRTHTRLLTRTKEDLEFLSGKEMGLRLKRDGGAAEAFLTRATKLLQALLEPG